MKKFISVLCFVLVAISLVAQVPQAFQYQAVVRDGNGDIVVSQPVSMQIQIIAGSTPGTVVYSETHSATTNTFGLVNIAVGTGTVELGSFSTINWDTSQYFINVKADITGGTSYVDMGTVQLLSVPYALYSAQSGSSGNNYWSASGDNIHNTNNGFVGVGTTTPPAKLVVQGDSTVNDTVPLFEVKDRTGATVFIVYPDSVRIYVGDDGSKTNKGAFAVSGRNTAKQLTNNFLWVTPDSTRIYLDSSSTMGGFAIQSHGNGNNNGNFFDVSVDTGQVIVPARPRIVWYPSKAAFLTGRVLIESPDSVGVNSFASGFHAKAIGRQSQALGYKPKARGDYSTAIGFNATADGQNSYAIGSFAYAGDSASYAIGSGAKSLGLRSFAIGSSGIDSIGAFTDPTIASGNYSYAFGMGSQAMGVGSFSLGTQDTSSGNYSLAIGYKNKASNWYSTAIGLNNVSNKLGSTAIGARSIASGDYSTVIGLDSKSIGFASTSIGRLTTSSGEHSIAIGRNSTSSGSHSMAIGTSEIASGEGSIAIGVANTSSGLYSTAIGAGTNSSGAYSTALGGYTIADTTGATAMGYQTNASGYVSTAMGYATIANASYSTSMGKSTTASGFASTAMGGNTVSIGNWATAMGAYSQANGNYTTAMGAYTEASAEAATAAGAYTKAIGYRSTAMGSYSIASGSISTSIGASNNASGDYSTAMGLISIAKPFASFVIGRYNDTTCSPIGMTNWIPTDPLFIIGNGNSSATSNAMTVLKNGETFLPFVYNSIVGATNRDLFIDDAGKIGYVSSSLRYKKDVTDMENIKWLFELRPVIYSYINDNTGTKEFGLIAEEVEKVNPLLVSYNNVGSVETVSYSKLITPLLKAVQDQQQQIENLMLIVKEQQQKIEKLEGKYNGQPYSGMNSQMKND